MVWRAGWTLSVVICRPAVRVRGGHHAQRCVNLLQGRVPPVITRITAGRSRRSPAVSRSRPIVALSSDSPGWNAAPAALTLNDVHGW
ncbi:hypothetical protein AB0J71_41065 [Nonomuraea sp. NPDC049637]|uniref:hypothetical protein n=1 Tax=Nonomuraea sp. NPDC049637 TaxID=3154356 RepID=UPI0034158405